MTLLNELAMKLSTNLELKDVLDETLKQAMDLHKADMGMIRFYSKEKRDLYHVTSYGMPIDYLKEAERIPLEQSVSGEAVLQRKTFAIEDVQRNKNLVLYKRLLMIKAGSFYCTPLITRSGKIIGTINLYYKKVRHFQEREIVLAEKYAKQAAEIIDDAILFQEAQKARRETERINQALSKSEAFYKAIGESIPFGVWATDFKGHMTHISDSYLKLIGLTFEEYRDFGWLKKITPDSEKKTFKDWADCVKMGGFWEYNFKILDVNNVPHAVLSRGIPVKDTFGSVTGWAGINLDITNLKKNEEMLKLLSDSGIEFSASLDYEETFESVAQMIVPHLADLCLVYLYQGKNLNRVTLSYSESVDKNLVEAMLKEQRNPIKFKELHPVQVSIRTGQPQLVNIVTESWLKNISNKETMFEIRKKMGWQSYMAVPMVARGQTIGAVAFVSITPGHKYTNSDLTIAEELANRAALAVDNARLYQKAKEALRARDEFLSIASHELKTPLTSLLLELELALKSIIESPGKSLSITQLARSIENAQWQSKRLNQLINNLLDLSRISAEKLGLVFQVLDLSDLVKDITDRFEEELKMSGYVLTLKTKKTVVGNWDKLRIEQILTNLLTNAIKYGRGKPIEMTIESDDSQAKLIVRDHGIGIPKKSLTSIFSPYERATDSQQDQSLGMGLYITKQLVEAHGGKISVRSKPNEGTTFTVELPLNLQKVNGKGLQSETQSEKEIIIKEPLHL
jgi:PAS domain S-box-containing protein